MGILNNNKIITNEIIFILVIILISIAGTIAVILDGFPRTGFDSLIQAKWYTNFAAELVSGDLYPRWLRGMNAGLGSPVFYSYGPLAYYISYLSEPFCNDPYGWCQLGLSSIVALISSGITMYVWLRVVLNDQVAGLAGAVTYIVAPWHLSYFLYTTSSISNMWAFVWIPLVLLGVYYTIERRRKGLWILFISEAALLHTNLASAFVFAPVPFIYAAVIASQGNRLTSLVKIFTIIILSFALSAPYVFGYFGAKEYISYDAFITGGFHYSKHFLDMPHKSTFIIDITVQTVIFITCCALAVLLSDSKYRKLLLTWLSIAILSLFMMLSVSKWIWEIVPLIQSLQFSWRYMTNVTLVASVVAAYATFAVKNKPNISAIIMLCGSLVIVSYWSLYAAKKQYWNMINNENADIIELEHSINMSFDLDHFRPKWVGESFWPRYSDANERLEAMKSGHAFNEIITTNRSQSEKLVAHVRNKNDAWLVFDQFYYPGWTVKTSQGSSLLIKPTEPEGLMTAWVPVGNHKLIFKMSYTTPEVLGMATFSIALIIIIILDILMSRKRITEK